MTDLVKAILNLSAFETRLDDPAVGLTEKVGKNAFVSISMTTKHIKFARAQYRRKLKIEGVNNGYHEDLMAANLNEAFFQELAKQAGPEKIITVGLNLQFSAEKIYTKGTKQREIERLVATDLIGQVAEIDQSYSYHVFPVKDQFFLGAIDQERASEVKKRMGELGFNIASVYNVPCAIIQAIGECKLEWEQPGMALFIHQNVITILGWSNTEIIMVKSRAVITTASNQKTMKIASQTTVQEMERTIREQADWIRRRAGGLNNVYLHSTGDINLSGVCERATTIKEQPIPWDTLGKRVEFPKFPPENPELACLHAIKDLQGRPENYTGRPPKLLKPLILALYTALAGSILLLGVQAFQTWRLERSAKQAKKETPTTEARIQADKGKIASYKTGQKSFQKMQAALDNVMRPDTIIAWVPTTLTQFQKVQQIKVSPNKDANELQVGLMIQNSDKDRIPDPGIFNKELEDGQLFNAPPNYSMQPAMINVGITPLVPVKSGTVFNITYMLKHKMLKKAAPTKINKPAKKKKGSK